MSDVGSGGDHRAAEGEHDRCEPRDRSERAFLRLLRVYPPTFRHEYAADAVELFRDRLREARARGTPNVARLWVATIVKTMAAGMTERVSEAWARARGLELGAIVRSGLRSTLRAPTSSIVVVLTLALGIGSTVAIYSVLEKVVLEPLPYPDADRLVRLWETNRDVDDELHGPSPWNFVDWEREASGIESMAAWYLTSATYRGPDWVEEIRTAQVTPAFFRTLGVRPALGRDFAPGEVGRRGPIMLSHGIWQTLFGGDPEVVGRTVVASGASYEIIGVMPPGFAFPDESVETWIGWNLSEAYADNPVSRTWRFLGGVARLVPDVSPSGAEADLDRVAAGLARAYPEMNRGWDVEVTSLHDDVVGDARPALWMAFGSTLFVLLIACANVANLLLARVPSRARDVAVRSALGASRRRLGSEIFTEYLILGGVAGVLGLLLGASLVELLASLDAGRIPRLAEVSLDGGVVLFAVGLSGATAVVFGSAPMTQLVGSVKGVAGPDRRTTDSRAHRRVREVFVGAQIAIALVLLAGAGVFRASLARIASVDPGMDPSRLAAFRVSLDPIEGADGATVVYYRTLLERVAELPGVERAAAAQTLPLNPVGNDFQRPFRPVGSGVASSEASVVQMRIVTPGYVETMGMRLLEGGGIPPTVAADEPLVAVVNRTLARRLWGEGSAVGETFEIDFREGWQPYRVVGVVEDVKHYGPRAPSVPEVFLAHAQSPYLAMNVVAKTVGPPEELFDELRDVVLAHRPVQPAHDFVSMEALYRASTAEERFLAGLLAFLGAVGLFFAGTGVYGVMAHDVSHRRREIGIRMALGAAPQRVVGAVVRRALSVAAVGVVVGALAVAALGGLVGGLLFDVRLSDPATGIAVSVTLLLLAGSAAFIPARRAAAVAPSVTLSSE